MAQGPVHGQFGTDILNGKKKKFSETIFHVPKQLKKGENKKKTTTTTKR